MYASAKNPVEQLVINLDTARIEFNDDQQELLGISVISGQNIAGFSRNQSSDRLFVARAENGCSAMARALGS